MKNKKITNSMIVIFGATGDLTKRKLIPGLYKLFIKKILNNVPIVCIGRKKFNKKEYLKFLDMGEFIKSNTTNFEKLINYVTIDFSKDLKELKSDLDRINAKYACRGNKLFYFATGSNLFENITNKLQESKILSGSGWKRVVFEKPFGENLQSSRTLNGCISKVFDENQIYRIDHYLGKELVQNILVLRFANSIFEKVWNRKHVDNVQIVVSEKIGVEQRGNYYDNQGAIKDMMQNHLLQLLSLITMDSPKSMDSINVRDEKVKVLKKLKSEEVIIGQYDKGCIDGKKVKSYIREKDINLNSDTETFAFIKTFIKNRKWRNVPFYLMTGKRLKTSYAEINLVLKDTACKLFGKEGSNVINIRIQPDEGISIRFNSKIPGTMKLSPVNMEFCHSCEFGLGTPEAYEKLLYEALLGDQTLFTRFDELEESWKFIDPIIKKLKKTELIKYESGVVYPVEVENLLKKDKKELISFDKK